MNPPQSLIAILYTEFHYVQRFLKVLVSTQYRMRFGGLYFLSRYSDVWQFNGTSLSGYLINTRALLSESRYSSPRILLCFSSLSKHYDDVYQF